MAFLKRDKEPAPPRQHPLEKYRVHTVGPYPKMDLLEAAIDALLSDYADQPVGDVRISHSSAIGTAHAYLYTAIVTIELT